jgi:SAM-dependent methyltransferase
MMDWNQLYLFKENVPAGPSPVVLENLSFLLEGGDSPILDLGCGAGRHLALLAGKGRASVGMDISANGLQLSRNRLHEQRLPVRLCQGNMAHIPFRNGIFGGVLSIRVIHHARRETIRKTMREIHRVLEPGGTLLITLLHDADYKYGEGREIEPDTFVLSSGKEKGLPHYFAGRDDLDEFLAGFDVVNVDMERNEVDIEGNREWNTHWIVLARRA